MYISIVIPCLNEERTIKQCVEQARKSLGSFSHLGEIIVVDNGSTDESVRVASAAGARVVKAATKGYGAAILAGVHAAEGQLVVMGDGDCSYDFSYESVQPFIKACEDGADLVIGNRFRGGIKRGAMPALHRYFGTPMMSLAVNILFGTKLGDINCGLRAFRKESILRLGLQSTGMEFASEMIVRAAQEKMNIREVPTTLSPDGRDRKPHLRSFRDGWRHLNLWIKLFFAHHMKWVPRRLKKWHATFVFPRRVKVLAEHINALLPPAVSVLDVGCGDGKISHLISVQERKITGADVLARDNGSVKCVLYDGTHIPFEQNSFDYVLFVDVLHHTQNPLSLLEQAVGIARKGVIIKDHSYSNKMDFAILAAMDWVGNAPHGVALPYNYMKWHEWQKLFDHAKVQISSINWRVPLYPFPISIPCGRKLHFITLLVKQ